MRVMAEVDLGKVTLSENEIAAFMHKTGGSFTGPVKALDSSDTSAQIRNIIFSDTEPETVPDGCIVFVYE